MAVQRFELTPDDPRWPEMVIEGSEITKIYGLGDPAILNSPCVSIIGARRGTPYGIAVASMAGRLAAESGITVVSGGAMGADAAAARACLDAKGKTIVCAGTGADRTYPATSKDVFERAMEGGGAVMSLSPWGSGPAKWAFPRRNRLIAALSPLLVVAEAGKPSGTFSTADAATAFGKSICAAPGSIFSPYSKGTNYLIANGAEIIQDEEDLEQIFSTCYGKLRHPIFQEMPDRGRILSALVAQPMRPDDLAASLGERVLAIMSSLGDYELAGYVTRLPDGCYAPTEKTLKTAKIA